MKSPGALLYLQILLPLYPSFYPFGRWYRLIILRPFTTQCDIPIRSTNTKPKKQGFQLYLTRFYNLHFFLLSLVFGLRILPPHTTTIPAFQTLQLVDHWKPRHKVGRKAGYNLHILTTRNLKFYAKMRETCDLKVKSIISEQQSTNTTTVQAESHATLFTDLVNIVMFLSQTILGQFPLYQFPLAVLMLLHRS